MGIVLETFFFLNVTTSGQPARRYGPYSSFEEAACMLGHIPAFMSAEGLGGHKRYFETITEEAPVEKKWEMIDIKTSGEIYD